MRWKDDPFYLAKMSYLAMAKRTLSNAQVSRVCNNYLPFMISSISDHCAPYAFSLVKKDKKESKTQDLKNRN